jgi:exodeoxyribonuclease V gamma subunit
VLHRHRSNRVEALVDALAEIYAGPVADPLAREWLVVQGRGMAVWLSMELSRRLEVWADGACLYPKNFVYDALALVLGNDRAAGVARYDRSALTWAVAAALPARSSAPAFERLARYLANDHDRARRFQLAAEIANVLDRYLAYRPDMLLAWERGNDRDVDEAGEAWQPVLWRDVVKRLGGNHMAALERAFHEELPGCARLPSRIAVFGLSTMPPLYARVIAALARHTDVHVFSLSPSREHWTEAAAWARARRMSGEADVAEDNSLLSSLGLLGAEMEQVLGDAALALETTEVEHDRHLEPEGSELARLQADILHFRACSRQRDAGDESIAIHSCHGPMREVEVLRDQLLARFARGDLAPHQIVVMMPDVEAYAPLIDAVFDRPREDDDYIPYRIADRSLRRDGPVIEAFHRVLALAHRRLTAPEVLDLLALGPVQRRFEIAPEEVEQCAEWIVESGVRWGIDADHRAAHGQPLDRHNTWRFGIDRLMLGYALPSDGRQLHFGVLPHDEIEGRAGALLGKLTDYCETLFTAVSALQELLTFDRWRATITEWAERLLAAEPEQAWELSRIRETLNELGDAAAGAGFDEPVGIDVVRTLLEARLDEAHPERGFSSGGVTFCAMVPMRAIPFQMVCLLGMSDGAFPRRDRPIDIDLIAKRERRVGDRSRRDDDRYFFLEAVLSARHALYLSYVGQSIRDTGALAPSPLVSELCDQLGSDDRVVFHRLQPWCPAYFDGKHARLFSFDRAHCDGARALVEASSPPGQERPEARPRAFFSRPLPPAPREERSAVGLDDVVELFRQPVAFLMRTRLGIDLDDDQQAIDSRDPFELGGIEQWKVGQLLLDLELADVPFEDELALVRARGLLPPGAPGDRLCAQRREDARAIAELTRSQRVGERLPSLIVDVRLADDLSLVGEIDDRYRAGIVRHQFAWVKKKNLLGLWIAHLAQCLLLGNDAKPSTLVGRTPARGGTVHRYRVVNDARERLLHLVELYRQAWEQPLAFFPHTSFAYVQALRSPKLAADPVAGHAAGLAAARRAWLEEIEHDPYLRRAFADELPIGDARFAEVALAVVDPLIAHLEET